VAILTRSAVPDGVLAVAGAVVVAVGSWQAAAAQQPPRALDVWAFLLIAVAAGVLAWGRCAPILALAGSVAAVSGYLLLGYAYGPILLCVGWAMFEVARRRPLPVSAAAGAVAALVSVAAVLPRMADQVHLLAVGLALWAGCWLAVPWSLGAVVHVRAEAAERARRDLVARTALEERVRVSREVHDVAGHGFAVIAMQAGVALVVLDEQPEQVRASLEAIRAASTAALDELRGVLRLDRPSEGGAWAGSGIEGLAPLAERARAAGLPVDLHLGDTAGVRAEVGGVVYRVVREALTNVMRHAGPTRAEVTVGLEDGQLTATIADRGSGPEADHTGQGLAGLRARVEAAGGSFAAGARDGGGFAVRVRFPSGGAG
jgi:signal transduction histidine kinase